MKARKGTAKRNRACGVCKPWIAEGNGGTKAKYEAARKADRIEVRTSDTYEVQQ
jgi:hypothetical protein